MSNRDDQKTHNPHGQIPPFWSHGLLCFRLQWVHLLSPFHGFHWFVPRGVCCKADSDVPSQPPFHVLASSWGCLQSSQLVNSTTVGFWQFRANARTKHESLFRRVEIEVPTNRFGLAAAGFRKNEESCLDPLNPWFSWLIYTATMWAFSLILPNLSCRVAPECSHFLQLY